MMIAPLLKPELFPPVVALAPDEEARVRRFLAKRFPHAHGTWIIERDPDWHGWRDFVCVETGTFGQCHRLENGDWTQSPRGTRPIVLAWAHAPKSRAPDGGSGDEDDEPPGSGARRA